MQEFLNRNQDGAVGRREQWKAASDAALEWFRPSLTAIEQVVLLVPPARLSTCPAQEMQSCGRRAPPGLRNSPQAIGRPIAAYTQPADVGMDGKARLSGRRPCLAGKRDMGAPSRI